MAELATAVSQTAAAAAPPRTLTWKDGVTLAGLGAGGLFSGAGYLVGSFGTWVAVAAFAGMALIGFGQNILFSEMAAMFPDKEGGIALFAWEGWRDRFKPAGPIGAFG